MSMQTSFDVLSEIIERYETRGGPVRDVEATTSDAAGTTLRATVEVPVSLCMAERGDGEPAFTPTAASLSGDGDLSVTFTAADLTSLPRGVPATVRDRTVRVDGGEVILRVELAIDASDEGRPTVDGRTGVRASHEGADPDASVDAEADAGADDAATEWDALAAVRDESIPLYEDAAYLQRLYETCDTFAEMSEVIELDVSAETVRRYMIDLGVHSPTSYDTDESDRDAAAASDDPDASDEDRTTTPNATDPIETIPDEQLVTDGIGLPADLTIADIADAVVESRTLYEVHQRLDLELDRTRELLGQLNLLDLVLRRLGDDPDRQVTYEQIASRVRQCAPEGANAKPVP